MKLTKRERDALAEIGNTRGGMSYHFRKKSWQKLVEKGLARLDGISRDRVQLTAKGIDLLFELRLEP